MSKTYLSVVFIVLILCSDMTLYLAENFSGLALAGLLAGHTGLICLTSYWLWDRLVAGGESPFKNTPDMAKLTSHDKAYAYKLTFLAAEKMQMPMPQVKLVENDAVNACASRHDNGHDKGKVTLTSGIIHKLGEQELLAIIAHEIGHIRNGDIHRDTMLEDFFLLSSTFSPVLLVGMSVSEFTMTFGFFLFVIFCLGVIVSRESVQMEFAADQAMLEVVDRDTAARALASLRGSADACVFDKKDVIRWWAKRAVFWPFLATTLTHPPMVHRIYKVTAASN